MKSRFGVFNRVKHLADFQRIEPCPAERIDEDLKSIKNVQIESETQKDHHMT